MSDRHFKFRCIKGVKEVVERENVVPGAHWNFPSQDVSKLVPYFVPSCHLEIRIVIVGTFRGSGKQPRE